MSTAIQGDPGKLMRAKFPGNCRECGGDIMAGQPIYHSKIKGDAHQTCVEPGEKEHHGDRAPPAAPREASRAATSSRDDVRLWSDDDAARWAHGRPPAENAATSRGARDATAAVGPAAERRDDASLDAYVAPRRDSEFGRAGDREAARAEFRAMIRLQIEFLERLERLLA